MTRLRQRLSSLSWPLAMTFFCIVLIALGFWTSTRVQKRNAPPTPEQVVDGMEAPVGVKAPELQVQESADPESPPPSEVPLEDLQQILSKIDQLLQEARLSKSEASDQADRILSMMEVFLALLALFAGFGILQSWKLREDAKKESRILVAEAAEKVAAAETLRAETEEIRDRASRAWKELEPVSARLTGIGEALRELLGEVDKLFPGFRYEERKWMVGDPPSIEPGKRIILEDGDRALVLADQLKLFARLENRDISERFVMLGVFWRNQGAFPRAVRRLERAVELDPQWPRAQLQLGRSLAYLAATDESEHKKKLLELAKGRVLVAEPLEGRRSSKILHTLAWIYDEEEDFPAAIAAYREANELDKAEASQTGREVDVTITYNLCCSLVKHGDLQEALAALETVIAKKWKVADRDPDFAALRKSRRFGRRFKALIARERKAAESLGLRD